MGARNNFFSFAHTPHFLQAKHFLRQSKFATNFFLGQLLHADQVGRPSGVNYAPVDFHLSLQI